MWTSLCLDDSISVSSLCVCVCVSQPAGPVETVCLVVVIDYVDDDVALIASMKMYPDSMTNLNLELKLIVCVHVY